MYHFVWVCGARKTLIIIWTLSALLYLVSELADSATPDSSPNTAKFIQRPERPARGRATHLGFHHILKFGKLGAAATGIRDDSGLSPPGEGEGGKAGVFSGAARWAQDDHKHTT